MFHFAVSKFPLSPIRVPPGLQQKHSQTMYDPYGGGGQQSPGGPPIVQAEAVEIPPPVQYMSDDAEPLSFLAGKKKFLIKQRFEKLEALAGLLGIDAVEFANKYDIIDGESGKNLLLAVEESNCFIRCCCKPNHPLKLRVLDNRDLSNKKELFQVDKPFNCNCITCFDICAQQQKTTKIDSTGLGSSTKVVPCGGFLTPEFSVRDFSDEPKYKIRGPCCIVGGLIELCSDQEFEITGAESDERHGLVKHLKPGTAMEGLTEFASDTDRLLLELSESTEADVATLANLIGTVLLLDYTFYEGGPLFEVDPFTQTCSVNCCNLYCFGCIMPCSCGTAPDEEDEEGGEEAAEEDPAAEEEAPVEEEPVEEEPVEEEPEEEEPEEEEE